MDDPRPSGIVRFGVFEVDPRSGELRKSGYRIKIQEQPFKILLTLLERPGEVVTREELQKLIWPEESFGDFDHALNVAVGKLRTALNDSAEAPRFIETLSRRGYRFIGSNMQLPSVEDVSAPEELRSAPPISGQLEVHADNHPDRVKIGAWVLIGAVCVTAMFWFYMRWRPRTEQVVFTPIPFTAFPGQELVPTFSPDGTQIAFAWTGDPASDSKGFDLYVKLIGSENPLRLTYHPSEWIFPAWSPDGTQIAFLRFSGADTGLYVVSALGGPERKLRSATAHPNELLVDMAATISWSADGKWIAYVDLAPRTIFLLSVESLASKPLRVPKNCIGGGLPAFSHRGSQLAYTCARNSGEFGLYSVATWDGTPKLIATLTGLQSGIAWTGDDKRLILGLNQSRGGELLEITLANGSIQKLNLGQDTAWPAISQKGDRLAFTNTLDNINIWRKELIHPDSDGVKLLASTREQTNPTYSPDGKHIAFESNRAGVPEIWVSDSDGTNLVQISKLNNYATGTPRWSPDGKKIAFDSWSRGHGEVYVVDFSELMPRKLALSVPMTFQPSWSHDGRWIYFLSPDVGEVPKVYRCPTNGGNATMVSSEPAFGYRESFDGETLYFVDYWTNASLKSVSTKQAGLASPVEGIPLLKDAALWTVVPGGIYFVPADAPRSICYFDLSTRRVRRIMEVERDFNSVNGGLSVSPDGHWILYSQVDNVNSDIMLVDHFH